MARASYTDLRYRKVSNFLLILGTFYFLLVTFLQGRSVWQSLLGALVGLVVFLPFYFKGGMGAADLKLLSVVGLYLGPSGVFQVALLTALAGGALAVLALVLRASRRLPYAVAIAVGVGVYEFRSFLSF
ncbi:MAG: prepilin peptidase [Ferrovum myxofaciens]